MSKAESGTLDRQSSFGMIVEFVCNKMPGHEDKQQWERIVGNKSFPPGFLEIFIVGNPANAKLSANMGV